MAKMGMKYYIWAKMTNEPADAAPTYAPGKIMGKMVSINVTISNSEGELYADNMLSEYASEFSSGEMSTEVDNIALADQAEMYGASTPRMENSTTTATTRRPTAPSAACRC